MVLQQTNSWQLAKHEARFALDAGSGSEVAAALLIPSLIVPLPGIS